MADTRRNHDEHDLELVAAFAAGEATGPDLDRAERLLDACDLCVTVARELRAITLAVQDIPSVSELAGRGELPSAPRDFRLTAEQAQRLRPTGVAAPVLRWTDRIFGAVTAFGRPVGASLAALGLVGVLLATANLTADHALAPKSSGAPIAANAQSSVAPADAGSGAGAGGAAGAQPAATAADTQRAEFGTSPGTPSTAGPAESGTNGGTEPATWLLLVSLLAVVGGVGLVVVAARRA